METNERRLGTTAGAEADKGPVRELLAGTDPVVAGRQAVDHDVAAGVDVEFVGAGAGLRVGIGEAEGPIGGAVRVSADEYMGRS